jgi:hypothetical protein
MKYYFLLLSAMILFLNGFSQNEEPISVKITSSRILHGIPSASGVEVKKNFSYVISDDSPWLFEIDSNLKINRSILIHNNQQLVDGRLPKAEKPDFEAMVTFKWGNNKDLLIFGSGSTPARNVLVRVSMSGSGYEVRSYPLNDLYAELRTQGNIALADFNIEGAATWGDYLILMNRGSNHLILVDKDHFVEYVKDRKSTKKRKKLFTKFHFFELPKVDGVQARFSGGTKVTGEELLVFSASLENTSDWVNDGPAMGSMIGLIDFNKLGRGEVKIARVMKDGKPYTGKIESLDCLEVTKKRIKLAGVTDNDQGESEYLEIELNR